MPLTRAQLRASAAPNADESAPADGSAVSNERRVAAAAPPAAARRMTRSLRLMSKKRPQDEPEPAVAAPSANEEQEKQQAVTQQKKKARVSVPTNIKYNLRSSNPQLQQHPTVTPGTATRQIDFLDGRPSSPATEDDDESGSGVNALPSGVVDIFAERNKNVSTASSCRKPASKNACHCPLVSQTETINILSTQHLTDYGPEYCSALKTREEAQIRKTLQRTTIVPAAAAGSSSGRANQREEPESPQYHDTSEDDDDEDDDEPVRRARRTLAMAARRRTPSPAGLVTDTEPLPRQPLLSPRMRKVLVHWMSEVCVEYRLGDATYHLAVSLIDQLLTMGPTMEEYHEWNDDGFISDDEEDQPWFLIRRVDFQAVGCACLWIASKIEEVYPPRNDKFVYISDYSFSSEKLNNLETRICSLLEFRLQRVTPFHFAHVNLRASQACAAVACPHFLDHSVVLEMTLYLLELSRASYVLSLRKPSLVAAACMYLARATLGLRAPPSQAAHESGFWTLTLQYFTGYSVQDLTGTVLRIHQWHMAAESAPAGVTPAYNKYRTEAHLRVSLKTVLRVEDLDLAATDAPYAYNTDLEVNENGEVVVQNMAL